MQTSKQKVIQKRVLRKERFQRMARLRYRKETDYIAKPEALSDIEKSTDNYTLVHHYSPGIYLGERESGINFETSILNKDHLTNCVNVVKEDNIKIVKLNLGQNSSKMNSPSLEELEYWSKKGHSDWAERLKSFSETYNSFLMKHQDKFKKGSLDGEDIKRYKYYEQLKRNIQKAKPCMEVKTRFNLEEDYVSEITYNSLCIEGLGYKIDEFVDKLLREGIPRIKCNESDNGFMMRHMMDNFESLFEKTLEFGMDPHLKLMSNGHHLRTGQVKILITGYFQKKMAEISYLIVCDGIDQLQGDKALAEKIHMPVIKDESLNLLARKRFIEKYYIPPPSTLPVCTIRELVRVSRGEEDDNFIKIESEEDKIKEEISDIANEEQIQEDLSTEEGGNINNRSNIIDYSSSSNMEESICSFGASNSPYITFLQSYMLLFHNILFDYADD